MIAFCPRCNEPFMRDEHSGDYEHICQGTAVLKNEDVLVIGNWEDFTGSNNAVVQVNRQGMENKLTGRPQIEGNKETPKRTSRGFPTNRFRTRQHIEPIDADFFKTKGDKGFVDPEEYFSDI